MKKIFLALAFVVTVTLAGTCAAKDVWIEHYNGVDTYVMDDTITSGTSGDSRYFKVSTKFVRNGQLQKVVNWSFSKFKTGMWRYETNKMRDNDSVVSPNNEIFKFCMEKLGWSYTVKDMWCY